MNYNLKPAISDPRLSTHNGFTLIEVLVALTILGMILSIAFAGIRLGIGAWEKGDAVSEDTQRIRTLAARLSNEIGSMYPYIITAAGGVKEYAFKGEEHSIGFVTTNEDSMPDLPKGGFKYVFYSVKNEPEPEGFTSIEKMLPDKNVMDISKGRITLIEPAVKEIMLEYMDEKGGWLGTWDANEKKDMPRAVRIKLSFKQEGRLGEPITLTIPTRMTPMLPKPMEKGVL